jgi:uncharacterized membrane protein YgcG
MLLFAGPAHVGQSLTYRVTGTLSTQAAPTVSTLILNWTAPTRLYARLSEGNPTAVSIVRDSQGILSVATPNANDAGTAVVANLLNQLNFPAVLAARLNGADHTQTTLSISPPAPASPAPASVQTNVDLVSNDAGATLIADGNSANRSRSSDSGYGRRGGGMGGPMGGGRMGGGSWGGSRNEDQSGESEGTTPTGFALEAAFDPSGSLQHAVYREFFASTKKGTPAIEETFVIDRIENARQQN